LENINHNFRGIYRDILKEPGRGIVFDSGWNSNTIVVQGRMLIAGLISRDSTSGVQHLAVGQGDPSWDNGSIPATDPLTTTSLVNGYSPEIDHNALDYTYLNESGEPAAGPTNRLQISATLGVGYPEVQEDTSTYPLREFGLFGKHGEEFYMINCIRHPVIHKGENATLIRTVQLFF